MKRIAILASGAGTNAENIIKYFQDSDIAQVVAVFSDKADAGVLERAKKLGVPRTVFSSSELKNGELLKKLRAGRIDILVLGGFVQKVPPDIIEAFPERIVNIHPALLPDYGGKGFYGKYVHQAVVENEEEVSGITIHYVTEEYDEGDVIFQEEVELDPEDSWEDVQYKVRQLELKHYPEVIEYIAKDM